MGGQQSSTHHACRFLESASSPMPQGIVLPPPPRRPVIVTVPHPRNSRHKPLQAGDTFTAEVEEKKKILVKVPEGASPGQQMQVLIPEYSRMVASTLTGPPPGCKVFQEHPIIVANVSHSIQGTTKETASSKKVTTLMQKAQRDLLRKAFFAGCNSVLGIRFNVTTTSSTSTTGTTTLAMVSAYGSPCIIASDPVPLPPELQLAGLQQQAAQPVAPSGTPSETAEKGTSLMMAELQSVGDTIEYSDNEDCDSIDGARSSPSVRSSSSVR